MDAVPRRMTGKPASRLERASPRLFSISPGANFLRDLAETLAQETGLKDNPEALADAIIYVPNRRSATALGFELFRANGSRACLLPEIRALGDLETGEPPASAEAALADLPPAMPNARRIGELTKLVLAYYQVQGLNSPAPSAVSAARELARLLDQAALSGGVDWSKLETLVTDADLATHWQQSVKFLEIISKTWPQKLKEDTAMDAYARRFAAAKAMASSWQSVPPKGLVVIAGSTGATPASRVLMRAALSLPQGMVVLPGLDRDLPVAVWQALSKTPSHPQFTLARALTSLGYGPEDVLPWPSQQTEDDLSARRRLVHETLMPADFTADWTERLEEIAPDGQSAHFVETALNGLTMIEASDDADEAMISALMLRQALETEDRSAALVTPDAGLARQVSALLKRWGIEVPPSVGLPLLQTPAGSFAFLVMEWLADPSHPEAIMALLQNAHCRLERKQIETFDYHFMRRPRTWDSLHSLHQDIARLKTIDRPKYASYEPQDIDTGLDVVAYLLEGLEASGVDDQAGELLGSDWVIGVDQAISQLSDQAAAWRGEDGAASSESLRDFLDLCDPLGPQPQAVFIDLYRAEAAMITVASGAWHPRLAIWGPLEARLQTADQLILAGLNEGVWPAQPAADAFLPRLFRAKIGLSDPDERIGLSAHDFAQLACAPDVTLLTSKRRDDKPAVASRWIWRLLTFARGALGKDGALAALSPPPENDPRKWLKAIETVPDLPEGFSARPKPKPEIAARPRKLSVTRIETLIRDPYAIYCQYVLGLYKLDPVNMPVDARGRGTAIHKALEDFELGKTAQTADGLLALLEAELAKGGETLADLIALRDVRRLVVEDYLVWRGMSAGESKHAPLTEAEGRAEFVIEGAPFVLTGTADRIERRAGGQVAILDFKSGKPPTEKQVRSGLSPQMPLLGLIAEKGGFDTLEPAHVSALAYVQFGTKFAVTEIGKPARGEHKPVSEIIAETEADLIQLLRTFANQAHPYLSAPRPERVQYWSDYTRLARRDEWMGQDTYD
ncbi:MAG: double-strand break repair protein AddB [Henriciella sp.]